jgi:tetratricopeptide (TPR) repeat protein
MIGVSIQLSLCTRRIVSLSLAVLCAQGLAGCSMFAPQQAEAPVIKALGVTSAEDARAQAAEARAKGNVDVALRLYIEAADRDPMDAESLYQIGMIYEERKDAAHAGRAYARTVQIAPQHAAALTRLGLMYFENRQFDEAVPMLERSLAVEPAQWRVHNALGLIADARADHDAAVAHFDAALAMNPNSAALLNNRGYSHYIVGELDVAEAHYRAALASDSSYTRAWQNLGLVYARQGQYDKALATLERAVSPYAAANDVGYIAMLRGDYAAAEQLFDEAMRLSPRHYVTANENAIELRRRRAESAQASTTP